MKTPNYKLRFILALGANLAALSLCVLGGIGVAPYFMMTCLRILLCALDLWACKRLWQIVTLGVLHIAVTYCTERQMSWLYDTRFYEQYGFYDGEGAGIGVLATTVGVILASLSAVVIIVVFIFKKKQERKLSL